MYLSSLSGKSTRARIPTRREVSWRKHVPRSDGMKCGASYSIYGMKKQEEIPQLFSFWPALALQPVPAGGRAAQAPRLALDAEFHPDAVESMSRSQNIKQTPCWCGANYLPNAESTPQETFSHLQESEGSHQTEIPPLQPDHAFEGGFLEGEPHLFSQQRKCRSTTN